MNLPEALLQIVERLRGVIIEELPAIRVIKRYDTRETLHYIDPPYPHDARGSDGRYRYEMTDDEHRELAVALRAAVGAVVISGYRCNLYDELYGDWRRVDRKTYADGARLRIESLWMSPAVVNHPTLFPSSDQEGA